MKTSRWFDSSKTQLVLLPPADETVPGSFHNIHVEDYRYDELLAEMQRFRGGVYLRDKAIDSSDLTADGRHQLEIDESSWHLLTVDSNGQVCGCARYLPHGNNISFQQLWMRDAALATDSAWGNKLRSAVASELRRARENGIPYVEVGGWAISEERRWSCDALRLALSTFGLARCLGGCLGITTATVKHSSSSILRRMGGRPLAIDGEELPAYYDPRYDCEMEILRFDSRYPDAKYRVWIKDIAENLTNVPVFSRGIQSFSFPPFSLGLAERQLALV